MDDHRYRVGETVRFVKVSLGSIGGLPAGDFRIVGLLPIYHGQNQYRIQSESDGHQRVVVESEIALR
ncbi:MAG: hypothetical protein MJE12_05265 [Alphaproteobacteria bacterium]|nr:hypothetical protein [Alphaproteobacteria bacterium]